MRDLWNSDFGSSARVDAAPHPTTITHTPTCTDLTARHTHLLSPWAKVYSSSAASKRQRASCYRSTYMTMTMFRTAAIMSLLAAKRAAAADTASPNSAIPKPACDSSRSVSLRYSSSSERLYVESADGSTRGGCITLTEIWEQLDGDGPLYAVKSSNGDISSSTTGTWLLTEHLWIEDGITLQVKVLVIDMWGTSNVYLCGRYYYSACVGRLLIRAVLTQAFDKK